MMQHYLLLPLILTILLLAMISSKSNPPHNEGASFSDVKKVNFTESIPQGSPQIAANSAVSDEILKKFQLFKKFDTVEDYSDHHFSKKGYAVKQPSKSWLRRIPEEWNILESNLPDAIYVRVYESRMDLLRAVIIGTNGTPYHDGLFFFDVFFPFDYPKVPPQVHYHSGGVRINPNLYRSGVVCLSLLNTWTGSQKERWNSAESTILQVLVSIQGLILNANPYFNEPGYEFIRGTAYGEKRSLKYSEEIFILSLKTMVYTIRRPPKHFEDLVVGHFVQHAHDILVACRAYMDGAQVGLPVKGVVQDVLKGGKICSEDFKDSLAAYNTTLVNALTEIGAIDCEKFLDLAENRNNPVPTKTNMFVKFMKKCIKFR